MKITPIKISLLILLASLFLSNCDSGTEPEEKHKDMEITFHRLSIPSRAQFSDRCMYRISYHLSFKDLSAEERQEALREFNDYSLLYSHTPIYRDRIAIKFNDFDFIPIIIKEMQGGVFHFDWKPFLYGQLPLESTNSIFSYMTKFDFGLRLSEATIKLCMSTNLYSTFDSDTQYLLRNPHLIDDYFPKTITFYHYKRRSNKEYPTK